jgi:hypothetical protein
MRAQAEHELSHDEGEVEPYADGEGTIEARRKVVMVPVATAPRVAVRGVIVRMAGMAVRVIVGLGGSGGMGLGSVCHDSPELTQIYISLGR